ncbi:hypothetical protein [Bacillus pseudomycoides]|uniref:hypothetical protein n=1 Tax=Bacillus pseudomycoides TaxID=64104 RepID=UPI000BEB2E59|nr:hypothetical protein [Bacillus pseudomycoides]PEB42266.1 hypothetical protein COO06_08120 [Bacillus pseudomycoides]
MFLSAFSFYQLDIKNTRPQEGITNSMSESFYAYGSARLKAYDTIEEFLQRNNYNESHLHNLHITSTNNENDLYITSTEDPKNEIYRYSWLGIHKHNHEKLEITITYTQFADTEDHYRECTCCNEIMFEGYCIDDGLEYFCSDKCLHTKYTPEEYQKMYEDDWAYWTEWH